MENQKSLEKLINLGWKVKNIDKAGNVRFRNSHSVGFPEANFEPEFFWVEKKDLKGFFIENPGPVGGKLWGSNPGQEMQGNRRRNPVKRR